MTAIAVGIDVGGTFTDVVALEEDGTLRTYKVLNTAGDRADGPVRGAREACPRPELLRTLVHGTTVATNAILERKGARTALVTTSGFRDVLEFQHQDRTDIWDLYYRKPEPLVPRDRRLEVEERIAGDGTVVVPLARAGEGSPEAVARQLTALDIEAVAIVLINSYRADVHELEVERVLRPLLGDVHVSRSSAVAPQFREYDRAVTTVLNAYVAPLLEQYLGNLRQRLEADGFGVELLIMQSNGGVVPAAEASRLAATTTLSGPAGGLLASATLAVRSGIRDFLCLDMGGTSTDVALVHDGRLDITTDSRIGGLPNVMPTLRIETVGAGGGSIAWIDEGDMLKVGPRSAGADPGPACYGRGGQEPTVTDAWCVIGVLRPDAFFGGRLPLDRDAARRAFEPLASGLGRTVEEAAWDVLRVASAKMSQTLHLVSVEQGYDPRDFTLIAYGGAGPLHAAANADHLGVRRIIVPPSPGAFSAYGLLCADFKRDYVRTLVHRLEAGIAGAVEGALRALESQAADEFRAMGINGTPGCSRFVDLRYAGQAYDVRIPIDPAGTVFDPARARALFDAAHEARYGFAEPESIVEIVNCRVVAVVARPTPEFLVAPAGGGRPISEGEVFLGSPRSLRFVSRADLGRLGRLDGPLVVEELTATTFVPAGWSTAIDDAGNILLEVSDGE